MFDVCIGNVYRLLASVGVVRGGTMPRDLKVPTHRPPTKSPRRLPQISLRRGQFIKEGSVV
eukprot:457044-Amphidinium_carterae.1